MTLKNASLEATTTFVLVRQPRHSNVWRVDPNSTDWLDNATLWASGLTTVGACTFDNQGNFWAAEMFYPPRLPVRTMYVTTRSRPQPGRSCGSRPDRPKIKPSGALLAQSDGGRNG